MVTLTLGTECLSIVKTEFGVDIMVNSVNVDKSDEQLEHLVDFIAETYGRERLVKYVKRIYDND